MRVYILMCLCMFALLSQDTKIDADVILGPCGSSELMEKSLTSATWKVPCPGITIVYPAWRQLCWHRDRKPQ